MTGISVIIPTVRVDLYTIDCLASVATALRSFSGEKELLLVADRKLGACDFLTEMAGWDTFIKVIETGGGEGSACSRLMAIKQIQHQIVLFTDDDCLVPSDWATRMCELVMAQGIVAGNLCATEPGNIYSSVDAYVDQLRIRSRDESGGLKYISFPNFGIKKELLPKDPFSASSMNTTEDIELACKLRLRGVQIYFDESLVVRTEYPLTFAGLLKRKIKHGKGIAFLRHNLGKENCKRLQLTESPWQMLARWVEMSLGLRIGKTRKALMIVANVAYCAALGYYERKLKLEG